MYNCRNVLNCVVFHFSLHAKTIKAEVNNKNNCMLKERARRDLLQSLLEKEDHNKDLLHLKIYALTN